MFSLFFFLLFLPNKNSETGDVAHSSLQNTGKFTNSISNSNLNFQNVEKNVFGRQVPAKARGGRVAVEP